MGALMGHYGLLMGGVASPPATDPLWSSVVSLHNFPGADASTTFTDAAGLVSWTANGNAQIDTSLGYNTGLFDGAGDYLSCGSGVPTALQLGGGNFCIDFIVKTTGTGVMAICGNLQDSTGTGHYWVILNSTFGGLHTVQFGIQGTTYRFGTTTLNNTSEHHIELSRSGTSLYCFLDGVQLGTTQTLNNFTGTTTNNYLIGCADSSGSKIDPLFGYLRAFRVTKGAARHTASFTPPTAPFPTSA